MKRGCQLGEVQSVWMRATMVSENAKREMDMLVTMRQAGAISEAEMKRDMQDVMAKLQN